MTAGGWSEIAERPSLCITLQLTYRYDPVADLYTYTYSLTNADLSRDPIRSFILRGIPSEPQILAPPGWHGAYESGAGGSVTWNASAAAALQPDSQTAAVVPRPGTTTCCFDLITPIAPDSVDFEILPVRTEAIDSGKKDKEIGAVNETTATRWAIFELDSSGTSHFQSAPNQSDIKGPEETKVTGFVLGPGSRAPSE
jgi:hypothetical protein